MSRATVCARPGCQEEATAWLTYDYGGQRVWLDGEAGAEAGDQWGLCSAHAGRLSSPRGWVLIDRRGGRASSRYVPADPFTSSATLAS
ncbi:MAG: DUF3499 domain-containing protein [Actinomycetota bacterium]|nr:DUF3499 domain-containing protein [Actinomycetota bacterium]